MFGTSSLLVTEVLRVNLHLIYLIQPTPVALL